MRYQGSKGRIVFEPLRGEIRLYKRFWALLVIPRTAMDESPSIGAKLYCLWATLAIGLSITLSGFTAENVTRILVIVFLLGQIPLHSKLANALPWFAPRTRFIALGTGLAAIVEGFHMISMPVFLSLRIEQSMSIAEGLMCYACLLYTSRCV